MIRALQVARYVWKIYVVDDDGKVDIWNYRGQVQRSAYAYHALKATYSPDPTGEPLLISIEHDYHTLAEAAESIA